VRRELISQIQPFRMTDGRIKSCLNQIEPFAESNAQSLNLDFSYHPRGSFLAFPMARERAHSYNFSAGDDKS
jgi:hypothetical protein